MAYCSKCGADIGESAFCAQCGTSASIATPDTNPTNVTQDTPSTNVTDERALMQAFIGPNAYYYMGKFDEMPAAGDFIPGWNWSAFFLGLWWFLYRKMYVYAALAWAVTLILSPATAGAGGLAAMVLMGIFGNSLYRKFVREEIAKTAALNPAVRMSALQSKGGVTWVPVLIAIAVVFVVGFIGFAAFVAFFASSSHMYY